MHYALRITHYAPISLALACTGCSLFGPPRVSELAAHYQGRLHDEPLSPQQILAIVQTNDSRIRTLKCATGVDVRGQQKGSFGAHVRCERPDRLFVYARKSIAPALFWLWVNGKSLSIRVDKTIYQGSIDAAMNVGRTNVQADAIRMLNRSFLGTIDIPETCRLIEVPSRSHEMALIVLMRGTVMWQTFEIERRTLLVARRSICDEKGNEVIAIRYRDYERFGGLWFPTKIMADLDAGRLRLSLALRDVEINEAIKAKVFQVPFKKGVPVRPLTHLWERQVIPQSGAGETIRDQG